MTITCQSYFIWISNNYIKWIYLLWS